jgi:hypothetical protein
MIQNLNKNVKRAIVLSLILNSALAFSGYYAHAYDSYPHMFFADHYRRVWFDTMEPKWYTGFNIAGYPPLAHQILALFSVLIGLEAAYVAITLLLMTLMPFAIFRFSKLFVSEEAAEYAAIISVFLPGILLSVYGWGQYTTLFGLFLTLLTASSFHKYLTKGGLLNFAELIFLFEATIATHHFSGIFCAPFLLLSTFFAVLIRKDINYQTGLKRVFLFLGVGSLFSAPIMYPVLFGAVGQNVNLPHPTTMNYFVNLELLWTFFVSMYGFFLLLIPLTVKVVWHRRDLQPLFIIALFLMVLGLGGTTFLPSVIFGENWLGLTYDRFNLFASLAFVPLLGQACVSLRRSKKGRALLGIFLLLSIVFSGFVGAASSLYSHPKDVPVKDVVGFLNNDNHWQWRYLTLGFGSYDFGKLSILSNATTLDGWYYRGRDIPALANSSVGYLSDAKFEKNGLLVLRSILNNSSQYNLKFVFCNDEFYEPMLNETGFTFIISYEQVTLWEKPGTPPLEIDKIVRTDHVPTFLDYSWGIIPMAWLVGYIVLSISKISRNRKKLLPPSNFSTSNNFSDLS